MSRAKCKDCGQPYQKASGFSPRQDVCDDCMRLRAEFLGTISHHPKRHEMLKALQREMRRGGGRAAEFMRGTLAAFS